MSLAERIAALSPEKRALLERRLGRDSTISHPDRISSRRATRDGLPLSFAQQRLWVLEQIEPGHSFYNLPVTIPLSGPVVPALLERAVNEVVRRHEALRTTFISTNGSPMQVVGNELHVPVELFDLAATPEADRESEATQLVMREGQRPFDLTQGPLLRAALIRLSKTSHILLVTMHHIVSDGWSIGILCRELSAIYAALSNGREPRLPELPIQYADFAQWQRDALRGEALDGLLRYWKEKLAGMPPLMEIPADRPRPKVQVFQGAWYSTALPIPLRNRLNALARESGATLFMLLLCAFKILLCRYTGRTDLVVGVPIANRNRKEVEGLIGFFVNTLVLRTDLSGNPDFRDALARIREIALGAFAHQDLPFEKLVEELQPARDLSYNPLFQVAFALQNTESDLPAASTARGHIGAGTSKFDLTLSLAETSDGLSATFEYNTELFAPESIALFASHYQAVLENIAADPSRRISCLPLIRGAERAKVLKSSAGPDIAAYSEFTAPALCAVHSRVRPDQPAVVFGSGQLTWRELGDRVDRLAIVLRAMGARPNEVIAVCLDRSLELPVAILGVLRAGAAFLPLDPAAPPARLAYQMQDTGARILLTHSQLADTLPAHTAQVFRLDEEWPFPPEPPEPAELPDPGMEDLAYVIYTSGSTGQPKGVMVPHRGLCNVALAQRRAFELAAGTRILQFASASFDASVFELLLALGSGGTLCLASRDEVMPGVDLLRTLRDRRIEVLVIPPSSLAMLPAAALPDLSSIICAGEALPRDLVLRWAEGRRMFNAYGPTETSIWATLAECLPGDSTPAIGKAIPNTQVYVLGPDLEPVPNGIPGEIYIGGDGVALGYLGRPELTAERYVTHPFSSLPGARLYRTGDRARVLPSGDLQFLGRVDQQLKVRGYRIEPGEIESALLSHPAVQDAAVFASPSSMGELRLAAVCTPKAGQAVEAAGLRSFARQILPEYMIPAVIKVVDRIPLTIGGKLDRLALSGIASAADIREDEVAPRTARETELAAIWREVLELESVGIHESFFDLGGHSLLATRVVSRVNDAFQTDLPLRMIFEHPSIVQMAAALGTVKAEFS